MVYLSGIHTKLTQSANFTFSSVLKDFGGKSRLHGATPTGSHGFKVCWDLLLHSLIERYRVSLWLSAIEAQ
jgi:hypothetical protein